MGYFPLPKLVIFDKDGTLIDFVAMWGNWAFAFIERVSAAVSPAVRAPLCTLFGVDPHTRRIDPHGALAIAPEATTIIAVADLLVSFGVPRAEAITLTHTLWQAPDPATTAVPCADIPGLFRWLTQRGVSIAVATADNRIPTQQTLTALGVGTYVGGVACADDPGVAPKPAPDKILRLCDVLSVHPNDVIMVGDTPADMQMGRNARVALRVAVTTGVATADELRPHADVVLAHIGLLPSLFDGGAGFVF